MYEPLYVIKKEGGVPALFLCLQASLLSTAGRSMRKGKWDDKPYRKTDDHGDCRARTQPGFDGSF
ncbi:hypothetical protein ETA19_01525 [Bacillus subtilis]|nr:hypothetical protein ETA19_01525 [Bacillus subtilis]